MGAVLLQEVRVDNGQARNSHLLKQGISEKEIFEYELRGFKLQTDHKALEEIKKKPAFRRHLYFRKFSLLF
jgi:hypothetical protein